MKSLVFSVGGSVIAPERMDPVFLKTIVDLLTGLSDDCKLFLIVGGGATARKYLEVGRKLGLDEHALDEVGIQATRTNAQLFTSFFSNSNKQIPQTVDEAVRYGKKHNVVVMGGTSPGHSTDMVAAELAESIGADKLMILTNVDGVHDKDPNCYPDASMLSEITIDELMRISGDLNWDKAGKNMVIDGPALKIIKRARIPTFVVNGKKLDNLRNLLNNKPFVGTKILT